MIELKNIRKENKVNNTIIYALQNVSIKFETGKLYAIMGHSGSGKSTLLHIIGLLESPTKGEITINNTKVQTTNEKKSSEIRAKKIGFVFQSYYLDSKLTAVENVILPMYINKEINKKDRKILALSLLNKVGLKERINHYPKELSGGEQQRVAIARALSNNPSIILADEPTGNLDRKTEKEIFKLFKEISNQGKTVIITSHTNEIKKYADKIIYIEDGKIKGWEEIYECKRYDIFKYKKTSKEEI